MIEFLAEGYKSMVRVYSFCSSKTVFIYSISALLIYSLLSIASASASASAEDELMDTDRAEQEIAVESSTLPSLSDEEYLTAIGSDIYSEEPDLDQDTTLSN